MFVKSHCNPSHLIYVFYQISLYRPVRCIPSPSRRHLYITYISSLHGPYRPNLRSAVPSRTRSASIRTDRSHKYLLVAACSSRSPRQWVQRKHGSLCFDRSSGHQNGQRSPAAATGTRIQSQLPNHRSTSPRMFCACMCVTTYRMV